MITKFSLFERFADDMKVIGNNSNLSPILKIYQEEKFKVEKNFPSYITINSKVRFHVIWNQNNAHDIYDKIKRRYTPIKSISGLRDKIKLMLVDIQQLLENHEIYETGQYGIILNESKFQVLIYINMYKYNKIRYNNKIKKKEFEIEIVTILPMTGFTNIIGEINLNI
jgi:hypothetical protein